MTQPESNADQTTTVVVKGGRVIGPSELYFYVNGQAHVVSDVDPERTLLEFLREDLGLTGTKLGCGEGGCGACTVTVQSYDRGINTVVHRAVNACLAPLCTMEGMHVITVEGIGSTRTTLHPVQERLAKCNGSQCGFCTPGFVMSVYSLLRSNPSPTKMELEHCIDGNLCRCTGYRPILDAIKSFGTEGNENAVQHAGMNSNGNESNGMGKAGTCPGSGKPCHCTSNGAASEVIKEESRESGDVNDPELDNVVESFAGEKDCELVGQKYLLLPRELTQLPTREICIEGKRCKWFRPVSLDGMLSLVKKYKKEITFVTGNTEIGVDTRLKNIKFPLLGCPNDVKELCGITESDEGITIGANITLSVLMKYFQSRLASIAQEDAYKLRGFRTALDNLKWFASTPIRNVASLAGNLVTASPISDLNPVWSALNCHLNLINTNYERRTCKVKDFFLKYRTVDLREEEVMESMFLPYCKENEYSRAYKQARRRDDDIAIVNAGIRFNFEQDEKMAIPIVSDCTLSFGGVSFKTICSPKTEEFLKGKPLNKQVFDESINILLSDINLIDNAPGGMVEFRKSLALSFFFKYFLYIRKAVYGEMSPMLESAIDEFDRPLSKGKQNYVLDRRGTEVGNPQKHVSAILQTSGEAKYIDDIPKHQNELHARYVLSTRPHASFEPINRKEVLAIPGVVDYVDARDVPGENEWGDVVQDEEIFRRNTVTSVGQPIGVILANDATMAKRAALIVQQSIKYTDLQPTIISIKDAIEHKSFIGDNHVMNDGDVDAAFADDSDIVVVQGEISVGGQEHFYLEPQGALAIPGEENEMTIFSSTQNLSEVQKVASDALDVPNNKIVAKLKRIGGGFGGKESRSVMFSTACAISARKTGRPVRMIAERDVDMQVSGQRHPFYAKYRAAARKDGSLVAFDVDVYNNAGYSLDLSQAVMDRALFHIDNCYKWPNLRARGFVCKTNLPSNTAFRGFGGPQGLVITEHVLNHLASALEMDPQKLRDLNLYKDGDKTHFGQSMQSDVIRRLWTNTKELSQYERAVEEVNEFNSKNRYRKRGISLLPTKFGIAFTATFLNQGAALVHIYTDGSVLISHGGVEMGQGLHNKVAAVASSVLNVPLCNVFIAETATDKIPNTSATAASVGSDLYAGAVQEACNTLMDRLKPYREKFGPDATMKEMTKAAHMDRVYLSATGFYAPPDIHMDWTTGKGKPFSYFTNGAAASVVEIDTLTGDFHILRSDIVMDLGKSLNPAIDIGQIEGAFTQGFGLFTMEELVQGDNEHPWYRNRGGLFTTGPGLYDIPSANDVPINLNVHLLKNVDNPHAVYSSKAVGEPPLFLGSTVYFAIKDAIQAARKDQGLDGFFFLDTPATSERIRMNCADDITKSVTTDDEDAPSWRSYSHNRPRGSY